LILTDSGPLGLLLELALEEIGTLSDDERIGCLDIVVESCFALDVGIDETFENQFGGLFLRSQSCGVRIDRRGRNWNIDLGLIEDGGSDVPTVLILSSDIVGDPFESVHESVSLLVVAAVEDMALEFGAVACELGGSLSLWLVSATTTATASTATAT
jgi:hypothetical protein